MIQFRPAKVDDIKLRLKDANAFSFSDDFLYFGVFEGEQCLGFCKYAFQLQNESPADHETQPLKIAIIDAIYIVEHERGNHLGDGLFRSTLNAIERNGVDFLECTGTPEELCFYKREGLDISDDAKASLSSIKSFFSKPCKGGIK